MLNQFPYQVFNPVMMEEYCKQQQMAYTQQLHHQDGRSINAFCFYRKIMEYETAQFD